MNSIRPIAINLPQFHPIPENDKWWGKGFTEWTNVTKATPLFNGHYQPHLPADLGFYDLRLEEARTAQAELAKKFGIYGFCYYHYWFHGKRLLERPVNEIISSGKPDFPFMLFWANESWGRRWTGEEKDILVKQTYSEEDDINHITWLCDHAFSDKRYITVGGRPAFIIYRPQNLPDFEKTKSLFKSIAKSKGMPQPYLIASNSHGYIGGFDCILNFEPQLSSFRDALNDSPLFRRRLKNLLNRVNSSLLKIYDYKKVKQLMAARTFNYKYFPSVFVGWDNTPRRGKRGIVFTNQNKDDFKISLSNAAEIVKSYPLEERLVFINAWNEWAEGNHLEPCTKYGYQFLNAVREVFGNNSMVNQP